MKISNIGRYKGKFCAELDNGYYAVALSSMTIAICEKVPEGMRVVVPDIVGGMMMRSEDDFRWCVEHIDEGIIERKM